VAANPFPDAVVGPLIMNIAEPIGKKFTFPSRSAFFLMTNEKPFSWSSRIISKETYISHFPE